MGKEEFRDSLLQSLCASTKHYHVLEYATGMGKTKMALLKTRQLWSPLSKILIVVPRLILIDNWKKEIEKWDLHFLLTNISFVTYVSLYKKAGHYDIVIFDECQHLSERCREALNSFTINNALFLSATIRKEVKEYIKTKFGNSLNWIKVGTAKAISNKILPTPRIILLPLNLNTSIKNCIYKKGKQRGAPIKIDYNQRWAYKDYKGPIEIRCTEAQYYEQLSSIIEWYKRKSHTTIMRNLWLHKAGERIKWLAERKLPITREIIKKIKNKRALVFCATIAQSESLNIPCVNSKVGTENLEKFNNKKTSKISCVDMLNEGINLTSCQIGVFDVLNASSIMQIQKMGRILRHPHPIIIIPYFRNTRDNEILNNMLKNYDESLITKLDSINDLKL
jgi:superfamily II DNA or RNA helicase